MWPWRDWVIAAFNRNLPFDRVHHRAARRRPAAERRRSEQRLATGFNRNHMQSQEGGIVPEEYRVEYVADRVNTFGAAFLGLTLECARCHDHKYDPITQKEFYSALRVLQQHQRGRTDSRTRAMPSPTVVLRRPRPMREARARSRAPMRRGGGARRQRWPAAPGSRRGCEGAPRRTPDGRAAGAHRRICRSTAARPGTR